MVKHRKPTAVSIEEQVKSLDYADDCHLFLGCCCSRTRTALGSNGLLARDGCKAQAKCPSQWLHQQSATRWTLFRDNFTCSKVAEKRPYLLQIFPHCSHHNLILLHFLLNKQTTDNNINMASGKFSDAFTFLPQGGIIQEFRVGGHNIVLGFPSAASYKTAHSPCFGETIGRVANR